MLMPGDSAQTQEDLKMFQGQISLLRGRLNNAIVPRDELDNSKLPVCSKCQTRALLELEIIVNYG